MELVFVSDSKTQRQYKIFCAYKLNNQRANDNLYYKKSVVCYKKE